MSTVTAIFCPSVFRSKPFFCAAFVVNFRFELVTQFFFPAHLLAKRNFQASKLNTFNNNTPNFFLTTVRCFLCSRSQTV